jgi:hypothetical protein
VVLVVVMVKGTVLVATLVSKALAQVTSRMPLLMICKGKFMSHQ